jgi:hypothetical protein
MVLAVFRSKSQNIKQHFWPPSAMFLWFEAFSLKVECSVLTAGFGHQTVQQTSSGNS